MTTISRKRLRLIALAVAAAVWLAVDYARGTHTLVFAASLAMVAAAVFFAVRAMRHRGDAKARRAFLSTAAISLAVGLGAARQFFPALDEAAVEGCRIALIVTGMLLVPAEQWRKPIRFRGRG